MCLVDSLIIVDSSNGRTLVRLTRNEGSSPSLTTKIRSMSSEPIQAAGIPVNELSKSAAGGTGRHTSLRNWRVKIPLRVRVSRGGPI